jgi:hypothetical protein
MDSPNKRIKEDGNEDDAVTLRDILLDMRNSEGSHLFYSIDRDRNDPSCYTFSFLKKDADLARNRVFGLYCYLHEVLQFTGDQLQPFFAVNAISDGVAMQWDKETGRVISIEEQEMDLAFQQATQFAGFAHLDLTTMLHPSPMMGATARPQRGARATDLRSLGSCKTGATTATKNLHRQLTYEDNASIEAHKATALLKGNPFHIQQEEPMELEIAESVANASQSLGSSTSESMGNYSAKETSNVTMNELDLSQPTAHMGDSGGKTTPSALGGPLSKPGTGGSSQPGKGVE